MTVIIFVWYLLTTPADKLICQLWINQPPSAEALIQSCGTSTLTGYRLDVIDINTRAIVCTRNADALATIKDDCNLTARLDSYILQIVKPNYSVLICTIILERPGQPTESDVIAKCPSELSAWRSGHLQAQLVYSQPKVESEAPAMCAAPNVNTGMGLYQQANSSDDIRTDQPLTWLAGRLIWFGIVKPDCGGSGLDPITLAANACGMLSARSRVTEWQNQFDADIYTAAISAKVPARLLKRMMMVESQMWPLFIGSSEETGMMQVTTNGVDVLLRYTDPKFAGAKQEAQYWQLFSTLNKFRCDGCSLDQAIQRTRELIPMYAQMLAAYRCRAVEIDPSLSADDAWRRAAADYNGSDVYLKRIEQ